MNTEKKELRNSRLSCAIGLKDMKLLNRMAKKHRLSKTEIVIRSIEMYSNAMKNQKVMQNNE